MSASEAVAATTPIVASPSKDSAPEKVVPLNGVPVTTAKTPTDASAVTQKVDKESTNETTKNGQVLMSNKGSSSINKSMNVLRERSFIRPTNPQMIHPALFMADPMHQKRRSFGHPANYPMAPPPHQLASVHPHPQQLRGKPELEIYRPPNVRMDGGARNKLNIHAQEFTMALPVSTSYPQENLLQLSKSGGNLHYAMNNRSLLQQHMNHFGGLPQQRGNQSKLKTAHLPSSQMPLVTSPSMGNVLQPTVPRVKFAPEPQVLHHPQNPQPILKAGKPQNKPNMTLQPPQPMPLQRSKSLSSADTIARGLAGLGFALGGDIKDIGTFPPEQQVLIDVAVQDPNQLNARDLMDLATVALRRAVEARRYALPLSQLCITIVAKERKETFLEALLNTCRQWYQEREKILGPAINSRNPSRPRFTAFMAFLTEMFCQLKRRQLQLRTVCDGVPPPMVLLSVLFKCCEDCVRPSVRSLSEIECLFYVLTCIGLDLETHMPEQLDGLLASVRDAFLNSNASAPAIRRTLLQLIELQASHWQLPGNTVLYYYPSK